jgi:hypothetical protein
MTAVATAIGAACLNTAGLEHALGHPAVINNLVSQTVDLEDESGVEYTQRIGGALDELARHQPLLRPLIMKAVLQQVKSAVERGESFLPSQEEHRDYTFDPVEEPRSVSNKPLATLTRVCKVCERPGEADLSCWKASSAIALCARISLRMVSMLFYESPICPAFLSLSLRQMLTQRSLACSAPSFNKTTSSWRSKSSSPYVTIWTKSRYSGIQRELPKTGLPYILIRPATAPNKLSANYLAWPFASPFWATCLQ